MNEQEAIRLLRKETSASYINELKKGATDEEIIWLIQLAMEWGADAIEEVKNAYGRGYNQGGIDRAEELQKCREYGYNKAIDDCYMKAKTMMEELAYQNQGRRNGKTHRLYCMQALEFLRQVAEELKGVQNGRFD